MDPETSNDESARLVDSWLGGLSTCKDREALVVELRSESPRQDLAAEAAMEGLLQTMRKPVEARRAFLGKLTTSSGSLKLGTSKKVIYLWSAAVASALIILGFVIWPSPKRGEVADVPRKARVPIERSVTPVEKKPVAVNVEKRPEADKEYFLALASYYLPEFQADGLTIKEAFELLGSLIHPTGKFPRPTFEYAENFIPSQLAKVHLNLRCFSALTLARMIAIQAGCKIEETARGFYATSTLIPENKSTREERTFARNFLLEFNERQLADYGGDKLDLAFAQNEIQNALGSDLTLESHDKKLWARGSLIELDMLDLLKADLQSTHGNWTLVTANFENVKTENLDKAKAGEPLTFSGGSLALSQGDQGCKLGVWSELGLARKNEKFNAINTQVQELEKQYFEMVKAKASPKDERLVAMMSRIGMLRQAMRDEQAKISIRPGASAGKVTVLFKETAFSPLENLGEVSPGQSIMIDVPSSPGNIIMFSATKTPPKTDLPYGIPVADKPGFVKSPYAPDKGMVDVTEIPRDTKVECPYTGKPFRAP